MNDIKLYKSLRVHKTNDSGTELLSMKQSRFTRGIALLICFATSQGLELTFGDAYATSGHIANSCHWKRLAVDFNLFVDGVYKKDTESYRVLGEYWESIGGSWGGRWGDGCHFSFEHKGVR